MSTAVHAHNASDQELDAIAFLVTQSRPDWSLVRTVLEAHRTQVTASDLAVAALRAAANPDYRTPRTIGWRGPHWHGLDTAPVTVLALPRCGVCGKREDLCETQRIGQDDDHDFEPTRAKVRRERAR